MKLKTLVENLRTDLEESRKPALLQRSRIHRQVRNLLKNQGYKKRAATKPFQSIDRRMTDSGTQKNITPHIGRKTLPTMG